MLAPIPMPGEPQDGAPTPGNGSGTPKREATVAAPAKGGRGQVPDGFMDF